LNTKKIKTHSQLGYNIGNKTPEACLLQAFSYEAKWPSSE